MGGASKSACVTILTVATLLAVLAEEHLSAPLIRRGERDLAQVRDPPGEDPSPVRVLNVEPVYPEAARAAGARGVVVIRFTIGIDGAVTHVQVERSVPLLDQAALDAVTQWRFKPALSGGVAAPITRVTAFTFR